MLAHWVLSLLLVLLLTRPGKLKLLDAAATSRVAAVSSARRFMRERKASTGKRTTDDEAAGRGQSTACTA